MRMFNKLPSISRVVPGAIATLELPLGPTYQSINFQCSGTALAIAHFGRINVVVDGKTVQTYKTMFRLTQLNAYYQKEGDSATDWSIHFDRDELMDIIYRRAPGMGTADVQSFYIEIEILATAPANITMAAFAQVDPVKQPLGVFMKVREYPFSSAVSGEVEIDKLPRGAFYAALHLFKADINNVIVEADQVKILDNTKVVLERFQRGASPLKRVPQTAAATHIDWLLEGDLSQAIKTADLQDFRVKMLLGTSGAVDIVAETLDTLDGV